MSVAVKQRMSFSNYNSDVKENEKNKKISAISSNVSSNEKIHTGYNLKSNTYNATKPIEPIVKFIYVYSRGSDYMNISYLPNFEKLNSFLALPFDWNDNGAERFTESLIDKCKHILSIVPMQPEIFPTAAKSIQFEYEKDNGDYLEFNVYEDCIKIFIVVTEKEFDLVMSIDQEKKLQQIVSDFFYG